ncbi:MAG TPA: endo-1,4-beta-xylanase [Phycisphaerae bacterium]|nr:endo-1,4-beta-xylanase [Phycisphaerae bacterium]
MLRFKVFHDGRPAPSFDLSSAYLVGNDRVPIRAEIKFSAGEIVAESRTRGAAALAILWTVKGVGRVMMETPRLCERPGPYNLNVELARGQLMRISQKREDWGLYDFEEGRDLYDRVDAARKLLISAITASDEVTAAAFGDQALTESVRVGEDLSKFHADVFLDRRQAASQLSKRTFGCRIDPAKTSENYERQLSRAFDFGVLPLPWRDLEPREGEYKAAACEPWFNTLRQNKMAVWAESLLTLDPAQLPEWLTKTARNYEQFRDCVTRHIRQMLRKYGPYVHVWEAIRGAHAHNDFRFTFEQIMELTRITSLLIKQTSPKSSSVIGITQPWGEYYANDPRTIPPLLYAEMTVSSGIHFDAFGIDLRFSVDALNTNGAMRDTMQISSMLDRFGTLGKPIHVLLAGVPSGGGNEASGCWRDQWSDAVQAEWFNRVYRIALSKPFVESVVCHRLADATSLDGILNIDCTPKPAFDQLLKLKTELGA